jgi:hypothetical protein
MRDPTRTQGGRLAAKRWRAARPGLAAVIGGLVAFAVPAATAAPAGAATVAATHAGAATHRGPAHKLTFPQIHPGPAGPVAKDTSTQGELASDACASSSSCVAVGYSGASALAEQWNGADWTKLKTASPAGAAQSSLAGVSCTSAAACTAVGYYEKSSGPALTLAERWNGKTWEVESTPDAGGSTDGDYLQSVSCSSPTECNAVGYYGSGSDTSTLAEQWNGAAWTVQSTWNSGDSTNELTGVSCLSPTDCNAVGYYGSGSDALTLAEQLNDGAWDYVPTENPTSASYLLGVSCSTATGCMAVGTDVNGDGPYATLAETFDGSGWSTVPTPDQGSAGSGLQGVSCTAADACTTVGEYQGADAVQTLAEAWNGEAWTIQTTPNGPGATTTDLTAVSCVTACLAAGLTQIGSVIYPVVAIGIIGVWAWWWIMPTPNPSVYGDVLNGVSCPSPAACAAVGYDLNAAGTEMPLALSLAKGVWLAKAVPLPAGAIGGALNGVSCATANACTAVGYYVNAAGNQVALAETWVAGAWALAPAAAVPAGATNSALNGVSCTAAGACTAVGDYINGGGTQIALAETLTGGAWGVTLTSPANGELNGVSCTAAGACTAVGYYYNGAGVQVTLAETLAAGAWAVSATPNPAGAIASALNAVSCTSATACTAVGYYVNGGGTQIALAETLAAGAWGLAAVVIPAGATASDLTGVSCLTSGCTAVGWYVNASGTTVTLAENELFGLWFVSPTPNPPGATASAFNGVSSCTLKFPPWPWWYTCTAVGYYVNAAGVQQTLAEQ